MIDEDYVSTIRIKLTVDGIAEIIKLHLQWILFLVLVNLQSTYARILKSYMYKHNLSLEILK